MPTSGMARSHEFGQSCEDLAATTLRAAGWTILARNYRFRRAEIDIIARRADVVAFVEVKGRRGSGYGDPLHAITAAKRSEIERVARVWIEKNRARGVRYRFDAIAVRQDGPGEAEIEHLEDAWRL